MSKYHKILGLQTNATEAEIKRAYRKLAMKYHPDKSKKDTTKFHEIKDAYEFLLANINLPISQNKYETREDDKIFVRKYNKWVTREEFERMQHNATAYQQSQKISDKERAILEFEKLIKSKVYFAFKYIAIFGFIISSLILTDYFLEVKPSKITITSVKTEWNKTFRTKYKKITIYHANEKGEKSSISFFGRKAYFMEEGTVLYLHKSPIFGFEKKIMYDYFQFDISSRKQEFHLPIAFLFLFIIILALIVKGPNAGYYFSLHLTVYGVPILTLIFLLYVMLH